MAPSLIHACLTVRKCIPQLLVLNAVHLYMRARCITKHGKDRRSIVYKHRPLCAALQQLALERQDLSRTYLTHHENFIIISIIIIIIITIYYYLLLILLLLLL